MSSDSGSGNPMGSDDDILAALSQLEVQTAPKPKADPEPKPKVPGSSPPITKKAPEKKAPAPSQPEQKAPSPSIEEEEPSLAPAPKPPAKKKALAKKEPEQIAPAPLPQNPAAVGEGKAFPQVQEAKKPEEPKTAPKPEPVFPKPEAEPKPEVKTSAPQASATSVPTSPIARKIPPKPVESKREVSAENEVSKFAPPGLKKLADEVKPEPKPTKEPAAPVAKKEAIEKKPKERAEPTKRERDLDLGTKKTGNRPRENAVVSQRAEGEPQHKWIKVAIAVVAAGALGVGSYLGITSLLTGEVDKPKPDPIVDPGGEKPILPNGGQDPDGGTGTNPDPTPPDNPGTSTAESNFEAARNRLIRLADDAIAEGDREAYEQILKTMADPNMAIVSSAAKAERMKVLQHFRQSNSPMNHLINVKDIFNNPEILSERHLTTQNKVFLLKNQELPWETRAKAAFLLAGTSDLDAIDELVIAIQTDPNLHVVRQAHATFEQITDYRGNLFDVPSLVNWWKDNRPGETSID